MSKYKFHTINSNTAIIKRLKFDLWGTILFTKKNKYRRLYSKLYDKKIRRLRKVRYLRRNITSVLNKKSKKKLKKKFKKFELLEKKKKKLAKYRRISLLTPQKKLLFKFVAKRRLKFAILRLKFLIKKLKQKRNSLFLARKKIT